jgi:flavodoxin
VRKVFDEISKKKDKKNFLVVYVGQHEGENIVEVFFEEGIKKEIGKEKKIAENIKEVASEKKELRVKEDIEEEEKQVAIVKEK